MIQNSESFVIREVAGAFVGFGRGPATGPGASQERLRQVVSNRTFPFTQIHWGHQVHGASCDFVISPSPGTVSCHPDTDALATNLSGIGLAVWTADCVPVLLCGQSTVAAVHCGWRGLAAGILPKVLSSLEERFVCRPSELTAVVGPAIGPCHYEVGAEVVEALSVHEIPQNLWLHDRHADLRAFARLQLRRFGLEKERIEIVDGCTFCDAELASYRRDGQTAGRQLSVVGLAVGGGL